MLFMINKEKLENHLSSHNLTIEKFMKVNFNNSRVAKFGKIYNKVYDSDKTKDDNPPNFVTAFKIKSIFPEFIVDVTDMNIDDLDVEDEEFYDDLELAKKEIKKLEQENQLLKLKLEEFEEYEVTDVAKKVEKWLTKIIYKKHSKHDHLANAVSELIKVKFESLED